VPGCARPPEILAPLGKQAQHLRVGLGIDLRQALVGRGGQCGGEDIEPVVVGSVACLERTLTRAERAWAARQPRARRPLPASPPGDDRARRRSPPPNAARGTVWPSAGETSRLRCSAGSLHARGTRRRVRRSQRRLPRRLVGIDPDQDLLMSARTSVSVGPLCYHWRARRTFRLRAVLP
jgi:hypothetical protein